MRLSLRKETGEGPGDNEYEDFDSLVNFRLLWAEKNMYSTVTDESGNILKARILYCKSKRSF